MPHARRFSKSQCWSVFAAGSLEAPPSKSLQEAARRGPPSRTPIPYPVGIRCRDDTSFLPKSHEKSQRELAEWVRYQQQGEYFGDGSPMGGAAGDGLASKFEQQPPMARNSLVP